ncbi:hypothetical protein [Pedobacter sp. R20-19]|uniref:hypothetical protein n=1 Tax=Pedobacter sp. R20-19 TaxID=1270196 RepID=UPI0004939D06|nr:hypothetical protein [Pedobacter sp. R20-19]
MLNLQQLEDSLDKALDAETYESLNEWFQERDKQKIKDFIGVQGYLSNLQSIQKSKGTISVEPKYIQEVEVVFSSFHGLAA